ncbi:MAG: hypothetical protein M3308_09880 [Actinomycetota bacterium]|nr:hypothetical protein [Actinomycetota bacterium]
MRAARREYEHRDPGAHHPEDCKERHREIRPQHRGDPNRQDQRQHCRGGGDGWSPVLGQLVSQLGDQLSEDVHGRVLLAV